MGKAEKLCQKVESGLNDKLSKPAVRINANNYSKFSAFYLTYAYFQATIEKELFGFLFLHNADFYYI